ncbi:replication initiation protein [Paenibacillus sp. Y412MC10]|uniref:replication initiation protein n=1 Tax=Geobacillus sp. (strain Y412MC10) TaxID=481743 RepID=UPI001642C079|nr:replication initiation protein [Paenibacillus sp. Y412MC10]
MSIEQLEMELNFEPEPISHHYIVSESNALIEAKTNLTLYEQRIIYILASRIHPQDKSFRTHFFKVKEIAEKLEITDRNFYKRIQNILTQLRRKEVVIKDPQANVTIEANWLASATYYHGKGIIELEFSSKLEPYLLQLKQNFTKFKLWNVLYLRSNHSLKLYMLLKQYLPYGKRKFKSIAELKEKLEIEPGLYERYSHLKNRVLLAAQKELAEKTDIKFEMEETKVGQRVVSITFHISRNKNESKEGLNDAEYIESQPITELLSRLDINQKQSKLLIKKFGEKRIRDNVLYVFNRLRNRDVTSVSGYIIKAIEENYAETGIVYAIEDPENKKTSLTDLNQRINKVIFFYTECMKTNVYDESEGTALMLKAILDDIVNCSNERQLHNLRPIEDDDLYHHYAKQALAYFIRDSERTIQ